MLRRRRCAGIALSVPGLRRRGSVGGLAVSREVVVGCRDGADARVGL